MFSVTTHTHSLHITVVIESCRFLYHNLANVYLMRMSSTLYAPLCILSCEYFCHFLCTVIQLLTILNSSISFYFLAAKCTYKHVNALQRFFTAGE